MRTGYFVCFALAIISVAAVDNIAYTNNEFLFSGVEIKNDKYWCLHNAIYRKPLEQLQAGRQLADASSISNMASYLMSGKLSFTSDPDVCQAIAENAGVNYQDFFTIDSFKVKYTEIINYNFAEWKKTGDAPVYTRQMMRPDFLAGLDKVVNEGMDNMLKLLTTAQIDFAVANGLSKKVILYVLLETYADVFKTDPVAGKAAWDYTYPRHMSKISGKDISDNSVKYFIEDLKNRYRPGTDVPTGNEEKLGTPYTITDTTEEKVPTFPDLFEEPNFKIPQFEVAEDAADSAIVVPYAKEGEESNKIPVFPPDLEETDSFKTPSPTEPEETPEKKIVESDPKDAVFRTELIEIQRSWNIEKALISFSSLTSSMQVDITNCKLSLAPAMSRCESVHGAGNCEGVTPTYTAPKCPANFVRVGCCTCIRSCPEGFEDNKLYCTKPKSYLLSPRSTEKDCYLANALQCEKVGAVWTPACKKGFRRIAANFCVAECPTGTTDTGAQCVKTEKQDLGDVFAWTAGDE